MLFTRKTELEAGAASVFLKELWETRSRVYSPATGSERVSAGLADGVLATGKRAQRKAEQCGVAS